MYIIYIRSNIQYIIYCILEIKKNIFRPRNAAYVVRNIKKLEHFQLESLIKVGNMSSSMKHRLYLEITNILM